MKHLLSLGLLSLSLLAVSIKTKNGYVGSEAEMIALV